MFHAPASPALPSTFAELPLLPSLLATLEARGLVTLTPVQAQALPAMLERRSVVAVAETGSGKTLSYVLPVLDRLKRMEDDGNRAEDERSPRALVLVPTRELGEQVAGVLKTYTHDTRLRVRSVLGGQKLRRSRDTVAGVFEVLVATPGRVDRLLRAEELMLDAIRVVVLDEADQLLDPGFRAQIVDIVRACPSQRQLALYSATMPPEVRELVARLFTDAVVVETAGREKIVPTLRTRHIDVPLGHRLPPLLAVLAEPTTGGTLIFANTREQCDTLAAELREAGWACAVHRGESDPVERRRTLRAFRDGSIAVLLSTDAGARGLDIEHVGRVVNAHLPHGLDTYLHRVGRTARAGREGVVVNLVTPRDAPLLALLGDGSQAPPPPVRRHRGPRGGRGPR